MEIEVTEKQRNKVRISENHLEVIFLIAIV